ncbi:Fc receptor-like protein 3 [Xenopus tropicalis]|uniref:Fc receptor-like protein 3 n=1 Tax=Xenopus tropicalis TaxID=8364 RepID=A0A8J1IT85_XENTR|nr:Fc receptor-like protein 3 [Xenopus tropicalis]
MSPLRLLLLLSVITENQGDSSIPFVSIDPNWSTVFTKESVTLTCNVDPSGTGEQIYYWYKDNQLIRMYQKSFKIDHPKVGYGGRYQCRTGTGSKSEAVRLQVSNDWLALKVPLYVYEGDDLYVACAGYPGYSARNAVLYRGNEVIASSPSDGKFLVGTANMAMSGSYSCTRQVKHLLIYYSYSSQAYISVRELFSKPVMKVSPNQVTEGDHMTITCDTELSPHRETTELQFAFYRNGHNVQGFSLSNQYGVPSAQLEDSGSYTCEVRMKNNMVQKRSNEINIQVTAQQASEVTVRLEPPQGQVYAGEKLEVFCSVDKWVGSLIFSWCKHKRTACEEKRASSQEQHFVVEAVPEGYGGEYQCIVTTEDTKVSIRSTNTWISVSVRIPLLRVSPKEVAVGDTVNLLCESKSRSFPKEYQFYHMEDIIGSIKGPQKAATQLNVTITSLTMAGPYLCAVRNDVSSTLRYSEGVTLSVMEPVANVTISPGMDVLEVRAENSLCLTCSVAKGTSPSLLWVYNNENVDQVPISGSYQVEFESEKVLCINSVQWYHTGVYQCQASNQLSPNRIFTAESNIVTITITERSYAVVGIGITLALPILIIFVVLLLYKFKIAASLSFFSCHFCPATSGGSNSNARIRQQEAERQPETNDEQNLYIDAPTEAHANEKDVCYTYIDLKLPTKGQFKSNSGEGSVTYAVVKGGGTKGNVTQREPNSALYENFNVSH